MAEPSFYEATDEAELPATGLSICTFRIGSQWLGLPVEDIQEIQARPDLAAVSGAPPFLAGLINLRGEILTVLDCAALLGLPAPESAEFLALIGWQGQFCCLRLSEPGDVEEVPFEALEPLPRGSDKRLRSFASAFWPGFEGGLILLETETLFPPRFQVALGAEQG